MDFEHFLDLTHEVNPTTRPYPGDPVVEMTSAADFASDDCRVTCISLGTHAGTHADAPAHVLDDGRPLAAYALSEFVGAACVADVRGRMKIDAGALEGIEPTDWLLLCTGQCRRWSSEEYFSDGPVFTRDFVVCAAQLARKGIGMDCAGLDRVGVALHRLWFAHSTALMVENLTGLETLIGKPELRFAAFPLKVSALDGAPVRAAAWW